MAIDIYNPNFPVNTTLVKDIPQAIRDKGEELLKYFNSLEEDRITDNLNNVNDNVKMSFVTNNADIPNGIYVRKKDYWYGFQYVDNTHFKPNPIPNERITINNHSYEYQVLDKVKVWSLSPYFLPILTYDFKEYNGSSANLTNYGIEGSNYTLETSGLKKEVLNLTSLISSPVSKMRTNLPIQIHNSFSISVTLSDISRKDKSYIIPEDEKAVILFLKDKFNNLKLGLVYDSNNNLYLTNFLKIIPLNYTLLDSTSYQIALTSTASTLRILINDEVIYEKNDFPLKDKNVFVSIADDNNYGNYHNGIFKIRELYVFNKQITSEENLHLKNNPRCFNLTDTESYLSLTLDDKFRVKNLEKIIDGYLASFKNFMNGNNKSLNDLVNTYLNDLKEKFEGELNNQLKKIQEVIDSTSKSGHIHDDRYYTEKEIDNLLNTKSNNTHLHDDRYQPLGQYASKNHNHNQVYYLKSETDSLLKTKSNNTHLHDDRYYTEKEINTFLKTKSDTKHLHDDRYYTESEVNSIISKVKNEIKEIVQNSQYITPVGTIVAFYGYTAPKGWLICNGQKCQGTKFAAMGYSHVPDLRGKFIRMIGGNAGKMGENQGDAIRNITAFVGFLDDYERRYDSGTLNFFNKTIKKYCGEHGAVEYISTGYDSDKGKSIDGTRWNGTIMKFNASKQVPTAVENRPVNVAFNYIIKVD